MPILAKAVEPRHHAPFQNLGVVVQVHDLVQVGEVYPVRRQPFPDQGVDEDRKSVV